MRWTSILAIYTLFWVFSAFLVLPFGVRSHEDDGLERVPGQAESAPTNFSARRVILRATALSIVLFALFYLNYVFGWITARHLDISRLMPAPRL